MTSTAPTVLIVPGLRDHVPEHWQTLLAATLPRVVSVAPLEQDKLSCATRVDAIDRALATIEGPVIIVAHSAGAMMVAHWAARGPTREILGALLAAPADLETAMPAGYPTLGTLSDHGWLPIPRGTLPFRSIVAASSNDPLTRLDRARGLAKGWGSRFVELGEVGHLNPASGYGAWPQAKEFIRELA
ncbi:alpha/beta hydrolase [Cupriavidus sp. UME77]|uniref:RBBP9/YdeN family alpha/beta hydrolase n=1 Tax=Cupriavidus sp. UME77 TaxID=1862321 RepID=UPI0016042FBC|nr:alpha/beta hydrolase [Cupriavidus sp. UME77]MBB1631885.1 alpha/beta hydrolase [Cupriavidus sp. UME77]